MPAKIWWDKKGEKFAADGNPKLAIKGLNGGLKAQGAVYPSIGKCYPDIVLSKLRNVQIEPEYCLYMLGTTDELRHAFDQDIGGGLMHLFTFDENLLLYYVRAWAGNEKMTVLGMAGARYWLGGLPAFNREDAAKDKCWIFERVFPASGKDESNRKFAAVELFYLRDKIIPEIHKEKPWL